VKPHYGVGMDGEDLVAQGAREEPGAGAPARSPFHDRLPIGERLPATALLEDPLSCFDQVVLKPLAPMLVPEQPRAGELDPSVCAHCRPSEHMIWRDDHWHLNAGFAPMGIPFVGGLAPHEHVRLEDASTELLVTLGPLLQRLSHAVKQVPGVARTHFSRWGDGSAHFHMWALARPLGMMQGRGPMLAFWDDVLPPLPQNVVERHCGIVARAMAEGGGEATVQEGGAVTSSAAAAPTGTPAGE